MLTNTQHRFAVMVVSCDSYSDLWEPFFKLFWLFWPDCPFQVYLISNHLTFDMPGVKNLPIGDDISWSDNMKKAIPLVVEDQLFLLLEDLFLVDFIKTDTVLRIFYWFLDSKANYLRINPFPEPDRPYNDLVGVVSKGTIYRTSTITSLWRKEVLYNLLRPDESAWDFEISGSTRSDFYDGFYVTRKSHFPIMNAVIRSKWSRHAIKRLNELGICPKEGRAVMSLFETFVLYCNMKRSKLFQFLPSQYRRNVREFFLGR